MSRFSLSDRFEWLWRFFVVHIITFLLLFISLVSFAIPYAGQVKPYFILMPIYFWSIYRPVLVPPLFLLLIGVLFDLISGQPYLGLSAFILLAAQWVIKDQRLFLLSQSFIMIWLGFALTCVCAAVLEWALFSILGFNLVPVFPALTEAGISILIFPVFAWILGIVNRFLPASLKSFTS